MSTDYPQITQRLSADYPRITQGSLRVSTDYPQITQRLSADYPRITQNLSSGGTYCTMKGGTPSGRRSLRISSRTTRPFHRRSTKPTTPISCAVSCQTDVNWLPKGHLRTIHGLSTDYPKAIYGLSTETLRFPQRPTDTPLHSPQRSHRNPQISTETPQKPTDTPLHTL